MLLFSESIMGNSSVKPLTYDNLKRTLTLDIQRGIFNGMRIIDLYDGSIPYSPPVNSTDRVMYKNKCIVNCNNIYKCNGSTFITDYKTTLIFSENGLEQILSDCDNSYIFLYHEIICGQFGKYVVFRKESYPYGRIWYGYKDENFEDVIFYERNIMDNHQLNYYYLDGYQITQLSDSYGKEIDSKIKQTSVKRNINKLVNIQEICNIVQDDYNITKNGLIPVRNSVLPLIVQPSFLVYKIYKYQNNRIFDSNVFKLINQF